MMKKFQHLDAWTSKARDAYASGARPARPGLLEWDIATKCSNPVWIDYVGAESLPPPRSGAPFLVKGEMGANWVGAQARTRVRSRGPSMHLEMWVPCRKCEGCLKQRARHWRMRAEAETRACPGRSWFGTVTLSPHQHAQMLYRARIRLERRGTVLESLSSDEIFVERCNEIGKEITLWLKRVRKESETSFRYMLVAEKHKSGLPHYHMLIHEWGKPIRHATLKTQWRLGFSDFKLVAQGEEAGAARYVAKYLTKAAASRVRASAAYGEANQDLSHSPLKGEREKTGHTPNTKSELGGLINDTEILRFREDAPRPAASEDFARLSGANTEAVE